MAIRHTRRELAELLASIPLFSELTERQRRQVARLCFEEEYAPGEVILKEGGDAQLMAVIVEGEARVVRAKKSIATVGVGDAVGEMSLIDGRRRSAAVIAETPVKAVVLHRTAFLELLDEMPAVARKLLVALAARLRAADRRLAELG